jgi:hypothetical protein
MRAEIGALKSMNIMNIIQMLMELPIIHIMNMFIKMLLPGAMATFQARYI